MLEQESYITPRHHSVPPPRHRSSIIEEWKKKLKQFATPQVKAFEAEISSNDLKDKIEPGSQNQINTFGENKCLHFKTHKLKYILGVITLVALIFLILGLAFLIRRTSATAQNTFKIKIKMPSTSASLNTNQISLSDSQSLGANKKINILVSEIATSSNTTNGNGRSLQQKITTQIQISYKDAKTQIVVSFSSSNFQGEVCIPIKSILQFVINNQNLQSNITNPDLLPQQTTFVSICDLIETTVKQELIKIGATDIRTSFDKYMDGKYNEEEGAFSIIGYDSAQSNDLEQASSINSQNLAELIDPLTIPTIDSLFSENETAVAIAKVVVTIVKKIKEVIKKNQNVIEEASGITIQNEDPLNGETSVYLSEPSDVLNGCTRLDDLSIRCTENVWRSGLLPVLNSTNEMQIPAIVVKMTL